MTARLYEPRDAYALTALHRVAFGEAAQLGLPYWRGRAAAPALCAVCERGGEIVAYCDGFTAADGGDIGSVGTHPDHRGTGAAGAALALFLDEAWSRGARVLHLEVAAGNAPARALYGRFGFERVGFRARYYEDGSDALVLARELLAPAASGG